ncbi:MAG TPA: alpha/beta hydrolase fold domain-containing protein, partial [Myxococcota bacterium]|nr:alpha/beta hydrolase fold domain-containing protein [Myxococcota bacterium]
IGISPWTDLTLSSETIDALADRDPMISRSLLELFREAYLGDRDPKTPGASPAFADLAGLPPLLLHVGTAEGLLGDAEGFAAKARAAGCDVTFEAWEDMIHVWHTFADLLPEGRQAIARIGEYLDARLA